MPITNEGCKGMSTNIEIQSIYTCIFIFYSSVDIYETIQASLLTGIFAHIVLEFNEMHIYILLILNS